MRGRALINDMDRKADPIAAVTTFGPAILRAMRAISRPPAGTSEFGAMAMTPFDPGWCCAVHRMNHSGASLTVWAL